MAPNPHINDENYNQIYQTDLPSRYLVRRINYDDYDHNILDCLQVLTVVGQVTRQGFDTYVSHLYRNRDTHYTLVAVDTMKNNRVVGTGSIIIEPKLYVHFGKC